jgi:hypothetical protein
MWDDPKQLNALSAGVLALVVARALLGPLCIGWCASRHSPLREVVVGTAAREHQAPHTSRP